MRVFTPTREALPAVVAFAGTDPGSTADLMSDAHPVGIGVNQFMGNRDLIQSQLKAAARSGGAWVTGHSLGGALAQVASVMCPSLVDRVVTFQSPGIDADLVLQLARHNRLRQSHGRAPITSTHYRVAGDIVPLGGEAFTTGRVHTFGLETDPLLGAALGLGLGVPGAAVSAGMIALEAHGAFPVTAAALQGRPPPRGVSVTGEEGDYLGAHSTMEEAGAARAAERARVRAGTAAHAAEYMAEQHQRRAPTGRR
jgi:hypothetical protein